jgi:hypothetical protein
MQKHSPDDESSGAAAAPWRGRAEIVERWLARNDEPRQ